MEGTEKMAQDLTAPQVEAKPAQQAVALVFTEDEGKPTDPVGVFWKFRFAVGEFVRDPFGVRGWVDTGAMDRGGSIYLVRYEGARCTWWAEHHLTPDMPD